VTARSRTLSARQFTPQTGCKRENVMGILAVAIGTLVISASHAALAQEHDAGPAPGELKQGETMRAETQRPAMLLARLTVRPLPEAQQAETADPREPEAMKAEMQQDQPMPAETEMPRDPEWTALTETSLGTTMDFPRAVFSMADGHAYKDVGRKYETPDGRAKVAVWMQRNTGRDTPASYLRRTFVIPRATLDYERFTPQFAVVSGVYGTKVYYLRCNLSSQSGAFHCFDLAYPVRETKAWDGIVTRMSRSLRPHDD
jgi:hypothetical protein